MSPGLKKMVDALQAIDTHLPTSFTYRKKHYLLTKCSGAAHNPDINGMIDNCSLCAPLWGMAVTIY